MIKTLPKRPHRTAEWLCTKCRTTNRKFVLVEAEVAEDRCVACHARHLVWPGERPVRWNAEAR